jgi:hypothetical protein
VGDRIRFAIDADSADINGQVRQMKQCPTKHAVSSQAKRSEVCAPLSSVSTSTRASCLTDIKLTTITLQLTNACRFEGESMYMLGPAAAALTATRITPLV